MQSDNKISAVVHYQVRLGSQGSFDMALVGGEVLGVIGVNGHTISGEGSAYIVLS